jgi:shikimate kinase/3-dehydroquinate synthase
VRVTALPAPSLPPGRPNLVVTGFMGTGKTTAGRLAADGLGFPFADLDRVLEVRAGRPIAEIFARDGEEAFRGIEREVEGEAARLSGAVVATGGGAVLDGEGFAGLARGACVAVLTCHPRELVRRLGGGTSRPLLQPDLPRRVGDLLAERAPAYDAAGRPLDTTSLSPEQTAEEVVRRYRRLADPEAPVRVAVPGPEGPYPVVIGPGALDDLASETATSLPDVRTVAVLADEAVAPAARRVAEALEGAGIRVATSIRLPAGEAAKSLDAVAVGWSRLRDAGLSSRDAVIVVGGGAALDAGGFVAATFARGVSLVNVPTTLLAMVDAALGGKVGVDHAGTKNLVGAFHHPRLVVADPELLGSLSAPRLREGLAEAVKAFVVGSPMALEVVATDPAVPLRWVIEQAVRVKAGYVAADPRDRQLRHALNLGHTFAHAIESVSDYAIPHGEAVSIGLVAAARLGARAQVIPATLAGRLRALLERLGLPVDLPGGLDTARLLDAVAGDKKRRPGGPAFVVPAPGGAALLEGLEPREALGALHPAWTTSP